MPELTGYYPGSSPASFYDALNYNGLVYAITGYQLPPEAAQYLSAEQIQMLGGIQQPNPVDAFIASLPEEIRNDPYAILQAAAANPSMAQAVIEKFGIENAGDITFENPYRNSFTDFAIQAAKEVLIPWGAATGAIALTGAGAGAGAAAAGTQDLGALISEGMGPQATLGIGGATATAGAGGGLAALISEGMGPQAVIGGAGAAAAGSTDLGDMISEGMGPQAGGGGSLPSIPNIGDTNIPNVTDQLGSGSNWIDLLTSGLQTLLGNNAIQGATEDQEQAIGEAIDVQDSALDKTIPLFEPYRLAGESALQKILGMSGLPGGTTFDIKQDPSYQFRLDESMKALESSAAAKGGLLSGDFANTALQRAGEYASTEYTNIYNRLANLVNLGTNAASNEAAAYSGHASNVSNLLVGRGEASAYGKIGSGNQLMDLASSVGDYLSTRSQSPATGTNRSSYGG